MLFRSRQGVYQSIHLTQGPVSLELIHRLFFKFIFSHSNIIEVFIHITSKYKAFILVDRIILCSHRCWSFPAVLLRITCEHESTALVAE